MTLPDSPATRHGVVAGEFSRLVATTPDWAAPAPVDGWTARDVVDHLVTWFPGFLSGGGIELSPGPSASGDPAAAWQHHAEAVQALLDERGDETFTHPYAGTHRLADAVDRFYTADVFMHTWDLSRATGQDETLDADKCAELLAGMEPMEDVLRASGQYGPRVEVPADADVQTRMLGFIGRDPLSVR